MNTLLFNNINSFKIGDEDANIYIGDKLISRFRQVEYISSTKTGGQYIDLGCQLMNSTDDIKIDIKFNIRDVGKSSSGSDPNLATLIGSQPEVSPWPGFILRRCAADVNYISLQTKWEFSNSTKAPSLNKWYSNYLTYSIRSGWENKHDWGNIYEFSETLDNIPASQVNDCTCTLFCAYDGNNSPFRYALADLYYLKLKKGGQIIRDLVPVYDKITQEPGLYDKQNDVFYKSQGDEPFAALS